MGTFALAWRLLRGGGRRGMLGSILTLAAVALVSALLLFSIAGNLAFAERSEHTSWRLPDTVDVPDDPTAIEAVTAEAAGGRPLTRVDLAATGHGTPPTPPGLAKFPEPGEVWVSPALAQLMRELPDARLADRFGAVTGELGDEALVNSADLIAVVGNEPDAKAMTAERHGVDSVSPVGITDFDSPLISDKYLVYRVLMAIATVLMVVPLLVFGGAAARLTVARRDQRLASLRLIGATPGQVVRLTVAEAVITATVGAVAGCAIYFAAAPGLALIPIDGDGWRVTELLPGPLWVAATLVGVPLLVGLSAVIGLHRVVVSPLGVVRRHTPPGLRAIRLLVLVGFVVAFIAVASGMFGNLGAIGAVLLLVLLGGAFLALNLVGPWVVSILGRITAALARKPSTLLAGRRLVDDPRSEWRTVAGIALTGFVAGFVALLAPVPVDTGEPNIQLLVTVAKDQTEPTETELLDLLPDKAVSKPTGSDEVVFHVTVPKADATVIDEFRTRMTTVVPGADVASTADMDAESNRIFADIRTGILVVLSVSLLIAMVSAAISGASAVLDRRQTYALLHLSGTEPQTLDRARRTGTLVPLAVMGGGSIGVGMLLAIPFVQAGGFSLPGTIALGATVGLGVLGILGAGALSRPLLRSVMYNATPRPD